jgi:hypothetical protein
MGVFDVDNWILTSEDFSYIDCRINKEYDKDDNIKFNRK